MFRWISLPTLFFLGACTGNDDFSEQNATPIYGIALTQSACEEIAKRNVDPDFLEPNNATFTFGACTESRLPADVDLGLPAQSGYAMAFSASVVDRWGYANAPSRYEILIRDGRAVRLLMFNRDFGRWELAG